jgi:hypothetical protein
MFVLQGKYLFKYVKSKATVEHTTLGLETWGIFLLHTIHNNNNNNNNKSKAIPISGREGLEVCEMLRLPHFV